MSRREFQFVSGGSSKFWAIDLKGKSFDVTFGKIGTPGTTQTKSFADDAACHQSSRQIGRGKDGQRLCGNRRR